MASSEIFEQASRLLFWNGRLVSYNDEISISAGIPELKGLEGAVHSRLFWEFLNRAKSPKVSIETTDNQMIVRSGHSRATLQLLPLTLPLSEIDSGTELLGVPPELMEAMESLSHLCSTDVSRRVLTTVRVHGDRIEASDGYRIARQILPESDLPSLLVPATTARLVKDYGITQISLGKKGEWLHFLGAGDTILSSRIFNLTYPSTDALFEFEGLPIEFPPTLAEVLDRAGVFAQRDQDVDEEVELVIQPGRILVKAQCEGASFTESIRSRLDLSASFVIRPDFLKLALKQGTRSLLGEHRIKFESENWMCVLPLRIL